MQDKKTIDKWYQTQNITIRKNIREMDLPSYDAHSHTNKRSDVNILVVGPERAGKSTLLRTLHYALNSTLACYVETQQAGQIPYDKYEIKRNKKLNIEGLTKVKETEEKLGVFGYEVNFNTLGYVKNPIDNYAKATELLNCKTLGCVSSSFLMGPGLSSINFVVICLSMVSKLSKDEATAIRFFISELEEKRMKFVIVGTFLDQVMAAETSFMSTSSQGSIGRFSVNQEEKLAYIEGWKGSILATFSPKTTVEIYCMENYGNIHNKQHFQNSQVINFYALSLLEKAIKKAPESEKAKKTTLKYFCF